jgi:hypothetical protein
MKRVGLIVLLLSVLGIATPGGAAAQFVSSSGIGDALIFPLIEVTNLDTLIAIESFAISTAVHKVRFRDGTTGAPVLEFELCLIPSETFTASVFREGSVTRVTSAAMHRINGVPSLLNATLTGNPTRAFMEVIGLREAPSGGTDTTICANPMGGVDVDPDALMGKVYYVKGSSTPPLAYGTSAVALVDFATIAISDGTVFGNEDIALALIFEALFDSTFFSTRYFVPASFGAVTQVVLSFPTGPTHISECPDCRVPSNLSIVPFTEAGAKLSTINLPSDTSLVRVISLSSSDIASDSGLLEITETSDSISIPLIGFGINTTAPSAPVFFNFLVPIAKE